jgi:phosphatidylethanolamine/phosphatidyl-N-methylethanolamine N-methyltransferase
MEREAILRTYRRYARGYDLYFGAVLEPGRRQVIEAMGLRPGDRVLEVGVGTGLSLPLYPDDVRVTGIDISLEMLARGRARAEHHSLRHVEALRCMDAEAMEFEDDSFDAAVAMYVVSVVAHPVRLVDEMRRVCKPDGDLYIVNHFRHRNPIIGGMERFAEPLSRLMGFHPDFCLDAFVRSTGLEILEQRQVNLFGYWTLLRARNNKADAPAGAVHAGQAV